MLRYDTESVAVLLGVGIDNYTRDNPPRRRPKGTKTDCLVAAMQKIRRMERDGYDRAEVLEALRNDMFDVGPKLLTEAIKVAADGRSKRGPKGVHARKSSAIPPGEPGGGDLAEDVAGGALKSARDGQSVRQHEDAEAAVSKAVSKSKPAAAATKNQGSPRDQSDADHAPNAIVGFEVKPDRKSL